MKDQPRGLGTVLGLAASCGYVLENVSGNRNLYWASEI